MIVLDILGIVLLFIGAVFLFLGSLGLLRMPDVFNKLQAGTKATTLGFLSVAIGLVFLRPDWALKLLLIAGFVLLTNPIGSHALARASKNTGVKMVTKESLSGQKHNEVNKDIASNSGVER